MLSHGLRWRKLDLHVHTPASHDYAGDRSILPADFVQQVLAKGIDGIAVTDHNTAEWVDRLVDAAQGTHLAVFPGVEITCGGGESGIHVIALFDRKATAKHVEGLLARLGLRPEQYGKPEATVRQMPDEVIAVIHDCGGLAILAHADSSKGVLKEMKGQGRIGIMNNPQLDAVEVTNAARTASLLDGTDEHYRRALPCYRASDNRLPANDGHCVSAVGTRFSWFKLEDITLDGLTQCFADPSVRIAIDEARPDGVAKNHPRIERLSVSQGFFGRAAFDFHDGLNAIIGGKGVGKSLVVEMIRFALDQLSPIESLREDAESKLDAQLGLGGVVEVKVRTSGGRLLTVRRTFDADMNPISATYEGGMVERGSVAQLFPIAAYSQTEPLLIARDRGAQLALIDAFIELSPTISRIATLRTRLATSDSEYAKALAAQERIEALEIQIATAEAKIADLDSALKSPEHDKLAELLPKTACLAALADAVDAAGEAVEGLADAVASGEIPDVPKPFKDDARLIKLLTDTTAELRQIESDSLALAKRVAALKAKVERAQDGHSNDVLARESAYKIWAASAGGNREMLRVTKTRVVKERDAASKELSSVRKIIAGMSALKSRRAELLDDLDLATQEVYELRGATYESLTKASRHRLRLSVERHGRRGAYVEALSTLKHGSKVTENMIERIAEAILPRELVELVLAREADTIAKRSGVPVKTVSTLVDHLCARESLTDLLACQHQALVDDEPSIEYQKSDGTYHNLDAISIGQKCTALLIIALCEGDRPVLIDQPEDALDTPSVYQDITLQVRDRKESRQFIITTHNPTVAVAGDTDIFQVLVATANEAAISHHGTLDREPVREAVIQHLEGGPRPWGLKIRKYRSPPV